MTSKSIAENLFVDEKACCSAFIGDGTTGLIAAGVPGMEYADTGGPWDVVFQEPAERDYTDEAGEEKKVVVDETVVYWEIERCLREGKEVRTGNFGPAGIWLGGKKYTVTREDKTVTEPNIPFVNLALKGEAKAGGGGGATIAYAGGYVICGFFMKPAQDAGNCNKAVTDYAGTMES